MRMPGRDELVVAVATAAVGLIGATVIVAFLQDGLGVPNPSAVYLVAVVASALVSGSATAVGTAIASFLIYNYLFTEPRYTLAINDPGVWLSALLLLFVGIVVGELAALQRSRTRLALASQREAAAIGGVSRVLATRRGTAEMLPAVARAVSAHTHMQRVWIALGADMAAERVTAAAGRKEDPADRPARKLFNELRPAGEGRAPKWVRVHQPDAGARGSVLRGSETYRIPLEAGGARLGSIWATRERWRGQPDEPETRLLGAVADQLALAMTNDRLLADAHAAEVARASDAVKSALLQSVSHDLRTPLAAIRAAAGTLRSGIGLSTDARRESAAAIEREAEHLNQLVTNLLDLGRIEAGALRAEPVAYDLSDLVDDTVERLRSRLGDRTVAVELEGRAVEVDPLFVSEALANIVENVIVHTPADVTVRITMRDGDDQMIRLTVEDSGPGVPSASLPRLFDKFYRAPGGSGSRAGTGIGLSVARGLIEASGGNVGARQSELGGLAIDIDLPRAELPAELVGTGTS